MIRRKWERTVCKGQNAYDGHFHHFLSVCAHVLNVKHLYLKVDAGAGGGGEAA